MNIADSRGFYWCTPSALLWHSGYSPLFAKPQTPSHCQTTNKTIVSNFWIVCTVGKKKKQNEDNIWMVLYSSLSTARRKRSTLRSSFDDECGDYNTLNTIHRQFSPYLYPFIIEYCILIVGIWYMMWANISKCPRKVAAAHADKHDSESSMIIGGGANDRESPLASGRLDCADNNSGNSECLYFGVKFEL